MRKVFIGVVAGLIIGTPAAHAAESGWKRYRGIQTGEAVVCEKVKGVPAIERDVHKIKGKTHVVVWCNGKVWGKR